MRLAGSGIGTLAPNGMGIAWPVTDPSGADETVSRVLLLNTITSVISSGVIPNGAAKLILMASEVALASATMLNASGLRGRMGVSNVSTIP